MACADNRCKRMGPLVGVRVLDLSRVLAGPWATQGLADFGAEVIKIERPGIGDDTRAWGPPWLHADPQAQSAYFLSANRGKKSVAIDFTDARGAALVRELAQYADVVVENFKVGALKKYALDFESLSQLNPRLIYCSITGFGQTGPTAHLPGFDAMIQAQGGMMSLTGVMDNEPGAGPQKVGVAIADLMTGMYAQTAITAALVHRQSSGVGQWIDLSLLDCQVAMLANQALNYLVSGNVPQRLGNAHPNIVPYQSFACSDHMLMIAVGNDRQFAAFCQQIGHPEWATDSCFCTNAARVAHRALLVGLCAEILKTQPVAYWQALFDDANVPCGPINDLAQVFAHPQVQARSMQFCLNDADGAPVPQVANPVRFSNTPINYAQPPPRLGEHTDAVLASVLQRSVKEIAELREAGVLG